MSEDMEAGEAGWLGDKIISSGLPDKRLARRMHRLLDQMTSAPGHPIPAACGDWAATKAAYRFFDNPRVTEHGVLAGHFAATARRCADNEGPILIVQDTTEFTYSRPRLGKIGFTKTINAGAYKAGRSYPDLGTRFLVRVQTNRLATEPTGSIPEQGAHRVFAQLSAEPWVGCHCVKIGQNEIARLHVKFATIETLPPKGKRKRYAPQLLTYIHALEINPPADRAPIDWKLVTNLPVGDITAAVEKLEWCALRWKVEVFHKVMKSGCGAEKARLEIADRLAKFLALIAVVSWRIFFLTMSAREKPEAEPETILTPAEIATLDSIDASRPTPRILRRTLASYLLQIAMHGGYLARKHDPPPGNMVVWRGLARLNDIAFGISIGTRRQCE